MLDRGLNHLKTPLTIYTTRDKIRLYFVDSYCCSTSLILSHTGRYLQWKHRGLRMVIRFPKKRGIFISHGLRCTTKFTFLHARSNMTVSTGIYMAQLHFIVDEDLCYGCGACIGLCPTNALSMKGLLALVEQSQCTYCELCIPSCPVDALLIESR